MKFTNILVLTLSAATLFAKVSQAEADRLGNDLTPYGAERAGNKEGTIPEWTGGYEDPNGEDQYGELKNPYPDDPILFTITGQNADEYKDKLSAGQYAMLKRYPNWKMKVYPTRRTASYPDYLVEAMKHNALNAYTINGGDGFANAMVGPPFPIPKSGIEATWNNQMGHYISSEVEFLSGSVISGGSQNLNRTQNLLDYVYSKKGATMENTDNVFLYIIAKTLTPPIEAGTSLLIIEYVDQSERPRDAWVYDTGIRRVRRAPTFQFDTAFGGGQTFWDAILGYNGSPVKYNFTLIGKRELYIPQNSYKLNQRGKSLENVVLSNFINPDYIRYELMRVWVVELNLKSGESHVSPKRVLYLNEDTWEVAVEDFYDSRRNIWRLYELYEPFDYIYKGRAWRCSAVYDLINSNYYVELLRAPLKVPGRKGIDIPRSKFTIQHLQTLGR